MWSELSQRCLRKSFRSLLKRKVEDNLLTYLLAEVRPAVEGNLEKIQQAGDAWSAEIFRP